MSKEPLAVVPNPAGQGRPLIADDQYQKWLDAMAPYLKMASTIYYAMDKSDILAHKFVIYEKYKQNDWFSERVDAMRREVGEMVNNSTVRYYKMIDTKLKQEIPLTKDEQDFMKWFAEKHRTAQPFFVTRTEQVVKDDTQVGKILDAIETTDYGQLRTEAQKQMVAIEQPVQDQGQTGTASDIQA